MNGSFFFLFSFPLSVSLISLSLFQLFLGCWELVVLSKNGVVLNDVHVVPPVPEEQEEGKKDDEDKKPPPQRAAAVARLTSGDSVSVADRSFLFLLPSKRAAVMTTEGPLEPGWLFSGIRAAAGAAGSTAPSVPFIPATSPKKVAPPPPLFPRPPSVATAAVVAPPSSSADAAAAADNTGAGPGGVSRPDTARTLSVEREMGEEGEETEEEEEEEKGGG